MKLEKLLQDLEKIDKKFEFIQIRKNEFSKETLMYILKTKKEELFFDKFDEVQEWATETLKT